MDREKHNFKQYFTDLYQEVELDMLHQKSSDYNNLKNNLTLGVMNDRDTDLHKIFYTDIKTKDNFKQLYCKLIRDIHDTFFTQEKLLIYQSFPSIRIQYMESVTIPPHSDSDDIGKHPLGEKNFIIPITDMFGTNTIHIESEPGKQDYKPIHLKSGELFYFNGNTCKHYNEKNIENKLRISLDFRVMVLDDYIKYVSSGNLTTTNPRDIASKRQPTKMVVGGYYQIYFTGDSLETMLKWYHVKGKIPQHIPNFDEREKNACSDYFDSGGYVTEYKKQQNLKII